MIGVVLPTERDDDAVNAVICVRPGLAFSNCFIIEEAIRLPITTRTCVDCPPFPIARIEVAPLLETGGVFKASGVALMGLRPMPAPPPPLATLIEPTFETAPPVTIDVAPMAARPDTASTGEHLAWLIFAVTKKQQININTFQENATEEPLPVPRTPPDDPGLLFKLLFDTAPTIAPGQPVTVPTVNNVLLAPVPAARSGMGPDPDVLPDITIAPLPRLPLLLLLLLLLLRLLLLFGLLLLLPPLLPNSEPFILILNL